MRGGGPLKRFNLIFSVVVITAFLSALIVEHSRSHEVPIQEFATPRRVLLDPLVAPRGEHELRGTVRRHDGSPAAEALVHLRVLESAGEWVEPMYFDHTDAAGHFAIRHLPAGRFEVVLILPGAPIEKLAEPVTVPAGGDVVWRLDEPPGELPTLPEIVRADLFGVILPPQGQDPTTHPLAGHEVVLVPTTEEAAWRGAFQRRTITDEDGRFAIEGLVVADYVASVLPPWAIGGSWPHLATVEYAHRPWKGGRVEREALRIPLESGELRGRLTDLEGRAIEGALVRVWPEGRPRDFWPPVGTDEEGGFAVGDLPRGRYRVRVHAGGAVVPGPEGKLVIAVPGESIPVFFDPIDPRPGPE